MAEEARLESVWSSKAAREFESRSLRKTRSTAGCASSWLFWLFGVLKARLQRPRTAKRDNGSVRTGGCGILFWSYQGVPRDAGAKRRNLALSAKSPACGGARNGKPRSGAGKPRRERDFRHRLRSEPFAQALADGGEEGGGSDAHRRNPFHQ